MAQQTVADAAYAKLLEYRPEVKTLMIGKNRPREILMAINLFCPSGIMFDLRELVASKSGPEKVTNSNGFLFDLVEMKAVVQGLQELMNSAEESKDELLGLHTTLQVKKVRDQRQIQNAVGPAVTSISLPKLKRQRTMDAMDVSFREGDDDDVFRQSGIDEYFRMKEKERKEKKEAEQAVAGHQPDVPAVAPGMDDNIMPQE